MPIDDFCLLTAHNIENLNLKISTAASLPGENVPVTQDNPQNTQSTVSQGLYLWSKVVLITTVYSPVCGSLRVTRTLFQKK